MRRYDPRYLLLAGLVTLLAAIPVAAAPEGATPQKVVVSDSRTGTGPCGFAVQRDLHGEVSITPSIDGAGNLVMKIERISLKGSLTNPANGKSIDLRWVDQNGIVDFTVDGTTTSVAVALTGHFFRHYYDGGEVELSMDLPADGVETLNFTAGESAVDAWTNMCGLLA